MKRSAESVPEHALAESQTLEPAVYRQAPQQCHWTERRHVATQLLRQLIQSDSSRGEAVIANNSLSQTRDVGPCGARLRPQRSDAKPVIKPFLPARKFVQDMLWRQRRRSSYAGPPLQRYRGYLSHGAFSENKSLSFSTGGGGLSSTSTNALYRSSGSENSL